MADRDNGKYYYLRLKEDFFESDELIYLESLPDGVLYSNILLKLYLRSLKTDGKLMLRERIPYNPVMLSNILRQPVGVIESAIKQFNQLGLIEILDNGAIYMTDIQNFIGKTSTEADRKRAYRDRIETEKKNLLPKSNESDKCPDKSPTKNGTMATKERDKDIEIELDIDIDIEQQQPPIVPQAKSKVVVDSPYSFWGKNMGCMTEYAATVIQDMVANYGEVTTLEGMRAALMQGKRTLAYVEGCCKNIHAGNTKPEKEKLLF